MSVAVISGQLMKPMNSHGLGFRSVSCLRAAPVIGAASTAQ
jgi:hypothetical protein